MADPIDFDHLRIRCGRCSALQRREPAETSEDGWLVYRFQCAGDACRGEETTTFLEIPTAEDAASREGRISLRNLTVRCGSCGSYPTLAHYRPEGEWNVYSFECQDTICDLEATRTFLEILAAVDQFANRDPSWHGGKVHAGAEHG